MSEQDTIQKTQTPNTIDSLISDFKNLGIKLGDIVIVHSSLSSLGWVCGGAQAVIVALQKAVGTKGTICMPSHSGDWSDPADWVNPPVPKEWINIIYQNMPPFNPNLTPTRSMGKIAELFRTYPKVRRSNHPVLSFSSWGKLSKTITKNHFLTPALGINSPLGKLYKVNAKILLLGVNYDSCTSFHLAEIMSEKVPLVKQATSILQGRKQTWINYEDYDYNNDDFLEIGNDFEKTAHVTTGYIGCAVAKLFSIRFGVDFAKEWLLKNRK